MALCKSGLVGLRAAAVCGLVAPLTYVASLVFGGLAQPDEFSSADDDISDLGAETASNPWIYNQVGMNLTGILIVLFAVGLWLAAPWGAVVWLTSVISMVAVEMLFPQIYGGRVWVVAIVASLVVHSGLVAGVIQLVRLFT